MPRVAPRPLAELTTLHTGGAPAALIEAFTTEELVDSLRELWQRDAPWLVIGGGSNLFIGDEDLEQTVVHVRTSGIERLPDPSPGTARVRAAAGQNWDDFVAYTVREGLAGVEALSGIPGTVGAAPVQNVGAYGQEIVQTLHEVELLDATTGERSVEPAAALGLGVRTSVLKHHADSAPIREAVILSATFDLAIVGTGPFRLRGAQVRSALGLAEAEELTLDEVRARILSIRAGKGMVLDSTDADTTSAGSFFENPIVTEGFASTLPAACPRWPVADERPHTATVIPIEEYTGAVPELDPQPARVKVSAAWLIQHAGLARGYGLPGSRATLSTKHTLALTNRGEATADEIAQLARFVQSRVQAEYGLLLRPEPVLVGVEL